MHLDKLTANAILVTLEWHAKTRYANHVSMEHAKVPNAFAQKDSLDPVAKKNNAQTVVNEEYATLQLVNAFVILHSSMSKVVEEIAEETLPNVLNNAPTSNKAFAHQKVASVTRDGPVQLVILYDARKTVPTEVRANSDNVIAMLDLLVKIAVKHCVQINVLGMGCAMHLVNASVFFQEAEKH
jgi:hypothetical protein